MSIRKKNDLKLGIEDHLMSGFDQFMMNYGHHARISTLELKSRFDVSLTSFVNPNTLRFYDALYQLPEAIVKDPTYDTDAIGLDVDAPESLFRALIPWRKGPFQFDNFFINSEWQSNMKWERFSSLFSEFENKRVIDIGCGNGYYMFRMLANNPSLVLGIDPSHLTYYQFHMIQHFIQDPRLHYLPLSWNDLSVFNHFFDIAVCMGVLYHHRSPMDLLRMVRDCMSNKGFVLFDTLIIDGDDDVALFPQDRYAKMPNVYFIPTISCLKNMFKRAGFSKIDILSIDNTSIDEQRVTDWTFGKSLPDFLDPMDSSKTIEGYPAPKRIALIAKI